MSKSNDGDRHATESPHADWEHAELLTDHTADRIVVLERNRETGEYRKRITTYWTADRTNDGSRRSITDAQ